jgi:hypothetical protein
MHTRGLLSAESCKEVHAFQCTLVVVCVDLDKALPYGNRLSIAADFHFVDPDKEKCSDLTLNG